MKISEFIDLKGISGFIGSEAVVQLLKTFIFFHIVKKYIVSMSM